MTIPSWHAVLYDPDDETRRQWRCWAGVGVPRHSLDPAYAIGEKSGSAGVPGVRLAPLRRSGLPDELVEVASIFFVAEAPALRCEIELPGENQNDENIVPGETMQQAKR
jgi:hypothetical protein